MPSLSVQGRHWYSVKCSDRESERCFNLWSAIQWEVIAPTSHEQHEAEMKSHMQVTEPRAWPIQALKARQLLLFLPPS